MSGDSRRSRKIHNVLMAAIEASAQESPPSRSGFIINRLAEQGYFLGHYTMCTVCGAAVSEGRTKLHATWHARSLDQEDETVGRTIDASLLGADQLQAAVDWVQRYPDSRPITSLKQGREAISAARSLLLSFISEIVAM